MGLVDVVAKKGSEKKILCIGNYRLYLLKVAKKKVEVSNRYIIDYIIYSSIDRI